MVAMSSSHSSSSLFVLVVFFLGISVSGIVEGPSPGFPSSSSSSLLSSSSTFLFLPFQMMFVSISVFSQGQMTSILLPSVIDQVAQFQCSYSPARLRVCLIQLGRGLVETEV